MRSPIIPAKVCLLLETCYESDVFPNQQDLIVEYDFSVQFFWDMMKNIFKTSVNKRIIYIYIYKKTLVDGVARNQDTDIQQLAGLAYNVTPCWHSKVSKRICKYELN